MGVSTDVWRARIGAFHSVMTSISKCQRKSWPRKKMTRTYKRPPRDSKSHHVTIELTLCLFVLVLACQAGNDNPLKSIREQGVDRVVLNGLVMYLGVSHDINRRTWQERLTIALRMAMFVLLLMCGDVESNPGPNGDELSGAIRKKVHKIIRNDTNEKFGTSASCLDDLWTEVLNRWKDMEREDCILAEEDGTEVCDEPYFQELESKAPLFICLKSKDSKTSFQRISSQTRKRPLPDDVIHEIATDHLSHDIVKLGTYMGMKRSRIFIYEAENATEPRVESMGTEMMIKDWRKGLGDRDQVGAFCSILHEAGLMELEGNLQRGNIHSKHGVTGSDILLELQDQLKQFYVHVLCYVKTAPWEQDSSVPINDTFNQPTLFHREKTSKHETKRQGSCKEPPFSHVYSSIQSFNEDHIQSTESMGNLLGSYTDIFTIRQNDVLPSRILIIGDPGTGKTTLLHKLAHDWAVGDEDSTCKEFKLLIHLSLCKVLLNANLGDEILRQLLPDDTQLKSEEIEDCIRQNNDDVALILDGFDDSVFASISQLDNVDYGSLLLAIIYKQFCLCRIAITTRPWKLYNFNGDLFDPYARIIINGFSSSSITSFIDLYCNTDDASRVKEKLGGDLLYLTPLMRVPIFLAMICKLITNDAMIYSPVTLTNLLMLFCQFLFKTCQEKYKHDTFSQESMQQLRMRDCLMSLGEVAQHATVIELDSKNVTANGRSINANILEYSLKVGFISTDFRTKSRERGKRRFYFFHNILRELCVAEYILCKESPSQCLQNSGRGPPMTLYVMLFMFGLSTGLTDELELVLALLLSPNDRPLIHTLSMLVYIFFEGQLARDTKMNAELFKGLGTTLAVNMNFFNWYPAVHYFLSNIPQSQTGMHFTQMYVIGIDDYDITHNHFSYTEDSVNILMVDHLHKLFTNCPYLTGIFFRFIRSLEYKQILTLVSTSCTNIELLILSECGIPLDCSEDVSTMGIERIMIDERKRTNISNLKDIALLPEASSSTKLDRSDDDIEVSFGCQVYPSENIHRYEYLTFDSCLKPVNITNVIMALEGGSIQGLSFKNCDLTFTNISASIQCSVHTIYLYSCTYLPEFIPWLMNWIDSVEVKILHYNELNVLLTRCLDKSALFAIVSPEKPEEPINIQSVSNLVAKVGCPEIYAMRFTGSSLYGTSEVGKFSTIYRVHFSEYKQVQIVANAMRILSACFPKLNEFVYENCELSGSCELPVQSPGITQVIFLDCKYLDFHDIKSFLISQLPSIAQISFVKSSVIFDSQADQKWDNISKIINLDAVLFQDCPAPLNISDILLTQKYCFPNVKQMYFMNCKLIFTTNMTDLDDVTVHTVVIQGCTFRPKVIQMVFKCCHCLHLNIPKGNIVELTKGNHSMPDRVVIKCEDQHQLISLIDVANFLRLYLHSNRLYLGNALDTSLSENSEVEKFQAIQTVSFIDCKEVLNLARVISLLSAWFPCLHTLTLTRCDICLDIDQPIFHESSIRLVEFHESKSNMDFFDILLALSSCCPSITSMKIISSKICFDTRSSSSTASIPLKLVQVTLFNCLDHVNITDVMQTLQLYTRSLEALILSKNKLYVNTKNTSHVGFPQRIAIHDCTFSDECISYIINRSTMSTVELKLTSGLLARFNIFPLDMLEAIRICLSSRNPVCAALNKITLDSSHLININEAENLPIWCSEIYVLTFHNSLDTSFPPETVRFPLVEVIIFSSCRKELNVARLMPILLSCCPKLQHIIFISCTVSIHGAHVYQSGLQGLHFLQCRQVNLIDVMSFVTTCCLSIREMEIHQSDVVVDFNMFNSQSQCCFTQSCIQMITMADCRVPNNFGRVMRVGYPRFEFEPLPNHDINGNVINGRFVRKVHRRPSCMEVL